jgi:hypothetical protein
MTNIEEALQYMNDGPQHHVHLRVPKSLWHSLKVLHPEHGETTNMIRVLVYEYAKRMGVTNEG